MKKYGFTMKQLSYVSCGLLLGSSSVFAGEVYHLNFDQFEAGSYSKQNIKDDTKANYGKGFYDGSDPSSDRAMIDSGESVTGNGQSLRITFPAGKLKTADSGVDTRIPLSGTASKNTYAADELYLSYWIKFSDNFEFEQCGGKLPSLGGADYASRENQWKGRIMWRPGGSIQFYMELPHDLDKIDSDFDRFWGEKEIDGGSICDNRFSPYLATPGWHNIELHYKLNSLGQSDGLFEGWVDGNKGYKLVNADVFGNYRPEGGEQDKLTINSILLSTFLGGSSDQYKMAEDTYIWVDEFKVSTTRVNEYYRYNNGQW